MKYMSTSQVSEKYDLHRQTLLGQEKRGVIGEPPRTPGGKRRYPERMIRDALGLTLGDIVVCYGRVSTKKQSDNLAR